RNAAKRPPPPTPARFDRRTGCPFPSFECGRQQMNRKELQDDADAIPNPNDAKESEILLVQTVELVVTGNVVTPRGICICSLFLRKKSCRISPGRTCQRRK